MPEPTKMKGYIELLERWSREACIVPGPRFNCKYYHDCDASIKHQLRRGEGSCMGYIGRNYGNDFKLIFVGMDHGEFSPSSTYSDNYDWIQEHYVSGNDHFNAHYRGVVKHGATIFGISASHCKSSCLNWCHRSNDADCVLNLVAQLNIVKCVPETQENKTSMATQNMKKNCMTHLIAELRILHPQMIVFHGINSREPVIHAFNQSSIDLIAIKECSYDDGRPALYRSDDLGCHVLFLYHPARGWLERQWPQFQLWISYLRDQGLVPN